ncbi:uncharacterized protein [Antedon mediterranea]
MGKDTGCTNCVAMFNILLGSAMVALWVYSYFSSYTGKVLLLNFAAGAWAGGFVIIAGACTFVYSCVWNTLMGVCALSFNIFVLICVLGCAGVSAMDAFIEYRIYRDESYVPPSIDVSYIKEALQDALDDGNINEKQTEEDFGYDGALIYAILTLCCLLVTIIIIAWSCYFCCSEDRDDDDELETDDEDEYTNKRDNVSVRSPFTNAAPRGQVAEEYNYGRRNPPHSQQHHLQPRQNWGYYDDDYVTGYHNERHQPPLYEEQESPIGPNRGWGNRGDRHENGLYHQRAPPVSQKPRTKRTGMTHSNPDYSRQQQGIPRASSRYYTESLPDYRPYGRNQHHQQNNQRAYSIDGQMPYSHRRDDRQFSRRVDVNSDRSWMYNYY